MWINIDANYGFVGSIEEVEDVRKHVGLSTCLKLVSIRKTTNFGSNCGRLFVIIHMLYYNS
mgnify:CR=1 FL=1